MLPWASLHQLNPDTFGRKAHRAMCSPRIVSCITADHPIRFGEPARPTAVAGIGLRCRADGESPGCPGSSLPRRLRLADLRVSPHPAPSGAPAIQAPGCPSSCIFQRPRKVNLRVAPKLRSLGNADDGSSGYPESLIPVCRLCVSGLPRLLHLRLGRDDSPAGAELCILG
jgi:hypothetical protein